MKASQAQVHKKSGWEGEGGVRGWQKPSCLGYQRSSPATGIATSGLFGVSGSGSEAPGPDHTVDELWGMVGAAVSTHRSVPGAAVPAGWAVCACSP